MIGRADEVGWVGSIRRGKGSLAAKAAGITTALTSLPPVNKLSSGGREKAPLVPK
jgi:hypothetical protein